MNEDRSITAAAGDTAGQPTLARARIARPAMPRGPDVPVAPLSAWHRRARGTAGTAAEGHGGPGAPEATTRPLRHGGQETTARTAAVYRTAAGWRVGDEELPDLVSAMVFADLLVSELPSSARPAADGAAADTGDAETARLKMTIAQLEHALAHRVRVEQAIGVLTERHRLAPRQAFEMLRTAARSRGRRVQELADEVVANVTNPLLPVAEELARPPAPRRGRGRSRSRADLRLRAGTGADARVNSGAPRPRTSVPTRSTAAPRPGRYQLKSANGVPGRVKAHRTYPTVATIASGHGQRVGSSGSDNARRPQACGKKHPERSSGVRPRNTQKATH